MENLFLALLKQLEAIKISTRKVAQNRGIDSRNEQEKILQENTRFVESSSTDRIRNYLGSMFE